MDTNKFKVALIVVISMCFALYLGVAAATAQTAALLWVCAGLGVTLILSLGRNVWLLLPASTVLSGTLSFVPGSPAPWWGGMAVVCVVFLVRFLMGSRHFDFRFSWLDFVILLQVVAVGQAFVANPTGVALFGGDLVGGKTYFRFACAFAAYAALSIVRTDIRMIRWAAILMIFASLCDGALELSAQLAPAIAVVLLPFYSNVDFQAAFTGNTVNIDQARLTGAKTLGAALSKALLLVFPPLSNLNPLRFVRFILMVGALVLILLSGYRSVMGATAIFFVVASVVRGRWLDVVVSAMFGLVILASVVGLGLTRELPWGVQRVLSALPVDVDPAIRSNAENSSEWRFEMWRLALGSDRYIHNKWLGDGFAWRADEQAAMMDAVYGDRRRMAGMSKQEEMLAKGSYHGFHVETIRFTGVLGLALALVAMIVWFRVARRLIHHFKGRQEWGYVLYICIPFLIHPFYYMLVFGSYRVGFPELIVFSGLLKLMDNLRVRESIDEVALDPVARQASIDRSRRPAVAVSGYPSGA